MLFPIALTEVGIHSRRFCGHREFSHACRLPGLLADAGKLSQHLTTEMNSAGEALKRPKLDEDKMRQAERRIHDISLQSALEQH